jgi:methanogenic corrinoid protein MtbC1
MTFIVYWYKKVWGWVAMTHAEAKTVCDSHKKDSDPSSSDQEGVLEKWLGGTRKCFGEEILAPSDREDAARAVDSGTIDYSEDYSVDESDTKAILAQREIINQPKTDHRSRQKNATSDHLHELARTIESVIIPQLRVNLGVGDEAKPDGEWGKIGLENDGVERFARLVMSADHREAFSFVESLLESGVSLESVLLDLMAPAARHMNGLWAADTCSFIDVTLGMTRIQQILRQCRQLSDPIMDDLHLKGKVLLVPVPGEQHTFGLRIIEELLMRDGWSVTSNLRASFDDIVQMVGDGFYDVVGLSMSRERLLVPLQSVIKLIRHHSQNHYVRILVGGAIFAENQDLSRHIDSDAVLADARQAVEIVSAFFPRVPLNS